MGGRNGAKLLAASKRSGDKVVMTVLSDIRVKRFELVANAREVGVYRTGLDVVCHTDSVETESIRGWIDGEVMRPAEEKVGIERRAVCSGRRGIDSAAKRKCTSMFEALAAPRARKGSCHSTSAPSVS